MKTHEIIHPKYGVLKRVAVESELSEEAAQEVLVATCDEMRYPRPDSDLREVAQADEKPGSRAENAEDAEPAPSN